MNSGRSKREETKRSQKEKKDQEKFHGEMSLTTLCELLMFKGQLVGSLSQGL